MRARTKPPHTVLAVCPALPPSRRDQPRVVVAAVGPFSCLLSFPAALKKGSVTANYATSSAAWFEPQINGKVAINGERSDCGVAIVDWRI